jgi:hypothetical protein
MASTYLSRTPASSGNRQIWTLSGWYKLAVTNTTDRTIFGAGTDGDNQTLINFQDTSKIVFVHELSNVRYILNTDAVYRDQSAWYHVVVAVDTTQATDTNRVKIYVNGVQQTLTVVLNGYPPQNANTFVNNTSAHSIGYASWISSNFYDGYMANTILIDGQQLTPSSFGQTDITTGIWKPKAYTGSYGTNGFFLKFENSGSLGTDSSDNGNNFTVNGTPTQTLDTPSNVFATMNNLNVNPSATATFANGNNVVTVNAVDCDIPSTIGVNKGKWYWEVKWTADGGFDRFGICPDDASQTLAPQVTGIAWNRLSTSNGMVMLNSSVSGSWGSAFSVGDVINFALDCDNTALYIGQNGTWRNSGVPTSGASRTGAVNYSANSLNGKYLFPAFGKGGDGTSTWQTNFGNGVFATTAISSPYSDSAGLGKFQYQPPTGYYALCTKNINVYG